MQIAVGVNVGVAFDNAPCSGFGGEQCPGNEPPEGCDDFKTAIDSDVSNSALEELFGSE